MSADRSFHWGVDFKDADEFLLGPQIDKLEENDWSSISKNGALWRHEEEFQFV